MPRSSLSYVNTVCMLLVLASHVISLSRAFLGGVPFTSTTTRLPSLQRRLPGGQLAGRRHSGGTRRHRGGNGGGGRVSSGLRISNEDDSVKPESGESGDQSFIAAEKPLMELDMGDGNDRLGIFGGLQDWWERDGKEDLKIYAVSLAAALLIRTVAVEPRYIPSLSMFPTFEIGDQLAVEKLSVKFSRPYQRKDVVVFYPPPKFREFSNLGEQEALIKRVIAVDGDEVQIKDGTLFINGEEQFEEYVFEEPEYKWGPQTVPQGMVMVLGDNRNHSLDSHVWGFLPRENVIGRAVFKYWPPWRAGPVEGGL